MSRTVSLKARTAMLVGLGARVASRLLGKGDGGMVGGRVALKLDPDILATLTRDKQVVLVTGTNGKSTTTKMTAAALSTRGEVAANLGGDNMGPGITTAAMIGASAPFAVFEVDEMHLPRVARETRPAVIVLLNLSRDQLDRVGEIGAVEKRLRTAVEDNPDAVIVANCDDPLIVSAAWGAPKVQWVSVGAPWTDDATTFPRGGGLVVRDGDHWFVEGYEEFTRPEPSWWVGDRDTDSFTLFGPEGVKARVTLALPGRANQGNAAQAIVAAVTLGANLQAAAEAVGTVRQVAGRYKTYDVSGREANLLLAKNPAGWQEALSAVPKETTQMVVAVNGQIPDGEDLSWVWDVDFSPLEELPLERLIASGERAEDLDVRLTYSGLEAEMVADPLEAIKAMEPGRVQTLLNYTAFRDLKKNLENPARKGASNE